MILVWLLMGCSGDDEAPRTTGSTQTEATASTAATADTGAPPPTCSPSVHIGTGEQTYLPIDDTLEIVSGPQGGWHVLGAARICDLGATATVQFEATRISDDLVVGRSGPVTKPLVPIDDCCYGVSDVFTYLNIDGEARPDLVLEGERVRFAVVVTLPDTTTHADALDATLLANAR